MFRRVFLPVAGAGTLATAGLAARIAKSGRGRLRACHVVDRGLLAGGGVHLRDRMRVELAAEGRKVLRGVHRVCRRLGVPFSEILLEGDVVAEVVKAARRFRADLMVVSTRGHGRLKALLLGSLVPALVRQAPCPVLLVRRRGGRRTRTPGRRRAGGR